MNIPDLDERTILIIDSILNHFSENADKRHFPILHTLQNLHNQIEGLRSSDIYECFGLIDELLNVGDFKRQEQSFTIDKTKLNIFQDNGGIRDLIERRKSAETELSDRQNKINELIELQSKKLSKELDEKAAAIEKELKQTTIEKNKEQLDLIRNQRLLIWIALGVSLIHALIALINFLSK